ncbi:MAG: PTS sugar transporter subunit IIA [Thermodesulfobacteriota bacterium]
MPLSGLLAEGRIVLALQGQTKEAVLAELAAVAAGQLAGRTAAEILQVLEEREQLGTTGIGSGIAIPHGKLKGLGQLLAIFGRSQTGVPFQAQDGQPVHFFLLLLAPQESAEPYLRVLGSVTRFLRQAAIRTRLMRAKTAEEVLAVFTEAEAGRPAP